MQHHHLGGFDVNRAPTLELGDHHTGHDFRDWFECRVEAGSDLTGAVTLTSRLFPLVEMGSSMGEIKEEVVTWIHYVSGHPDLQSQCLSDMGEGLEIRHAVDGAIKGFEVVLEHLHAVSTCQKSGEAKLEAAAKAGMSSYNHMVTMVKNGPDAEGKLRARKKPLRIGFPTTGKS